MKALLAILCLCCLTSCEVVYGAWGFAYRNQGGYFKRQQPSNPTPAEAAANVLPRPGSSQPTHF